MKKLVVTGGSSGIGKGVIDLLGMEFQKVVNIDVHGLPSVDVRDYDRVKKVIEDAVGEGDEMYLFSNAGVVFFLHPNTQGVVHFCEAPVEQLHVMVDINLKGQINVLHAFIGEVIRKKAKGNIVVVSSISAEFSGGPGFAVYDATKAAVSALVKRLVPYAKQGIRINGIHPGCVRTAIGGWDTNFNVSPGGLDIVRKGQDGDAQKLGGKEVSISQLAEWVEFLFFKNHGANGALITIDEGLTLAGRDY